MRAVPFLAASLVSCGAAAVTPDPAYLDPKAGEGCWVHFFEEAGFERSMGRLAGDLYLNSFLGPGLVGTLGTKAFLRRAESLVVGPEARLLAYSQPGFIDEKVSLEPGTKVPDLGELGIPERMASLKIACSR